MHKVKYNVPNLNIYKSQFLHKLYAINMRMGPFLSWKWISGCEIKTPLRIAARRESTQWSSRQSQAMKLGVSVSGNKPFIMFNKSNRASLSLFKSSSVIFIEN